MRKQSGNRERVALFIPFHFPIGGLGLGATRIRDTSKHFDFLKFSLTFSFPKSKYFIQFPRFSNSDGIGNLINSVFLNSFCSFLSVTSISTCLSVSAIYSFYEHTKQTMRITRHFCVLIFTPVIPNASDPPNFNLKEKNN